MVYSLTYDIITVPSQTCPLIQQLFCRPRTMPNPTFPVLTQLSANFYNTNQSDTKVLKEKHDDVGNIPETRMYFKCSCTKSQ